MIAAASLVLVKKNIDMKERERGEKERKIEKGKTRNSGCLSPFFSFLSSFL